MEKQVDGISFHTGKSWENSFTRKWREELRQKREEDARKVELVAGYMATQDWREK